MVQLSAFTLIGCSFFAYAGLYTRYLRFQLHYSMDDIGTAFGMFGGGALTGLVGGWLGERLRKPGLIVGLLLIAADGYLLFHSPAAIWAQAGMSFVFGSLISGYLYPRFITVTQRCVAADRLGHIMAALVVAFYLPGLFVGYAFGKLVELIGWDLAPTMMVCLPAALACLLILFQDPTRIRGI